MKLLEVRNINLTGIKDRGEKSDDSKSDIIVCQIDLRGSTRSAQVHRKLKRYIRMTG